ncbi:MAG: magnesium chelatase, partial [Chloroflexi bacterium]|nr:magnesium chelatase [Chloroflexota bacterium]
EMRYQVYERAAAYKRLPAGFAAGFADGTLSLADEIQQARDWLPKVTVGTAARELGLALVQQLKIDSNRAEITLFEAARAHAAADEREEVLPQDVQAVALLALRQRQSPQLAQFFADQAQEDDLLTAVFSTKK